jgi:hypothetical protein
VLEIEAAVWFLGKLPELRQMQDMRIALSCCSSLLVWEFERIAEETWVS